MLRSRLLASLAAPVLLLAAATVFPALAEDTTAPEGTLVIENGREWVNDPLLDLDVTATDDVGVVSVRVRRQGGDWVDFAYSPQIQFSLGSPASLDDTQYGIEVEWADAAGNRSGSGLEFIGYDGTAPQLLRLQEYSAEGVLGDLNFAFELDESINGTGKIRFSSTGGTTWSSLKEVPDSQQVDWNPRDVSDGGSKKVGPQTVSAQVRDRAGNWSNVRTVSVMVHTALSIDVSDNLTTGQPITLTPRWEWPVSFQPGTICRWTFMWGNDASIYWADHDETYGMVLIGGAPAGGYCGEWRFTLPWTPVRNYLVELAVIHDGYHVGSGSIGGSPEAPNLDVAVGSTSRDITSSNLPMLYVLPEQWQLTVGVPATYTAHGVGGATVKPSDDWHVEIPDYQDVYPGSTSLTFTPTQPGHVTVCLYRPTLQGPTLGACYDPPVRRAASSGPTPKPAATDAPVSEAPQSAAPASVAPSSLPSVAPSSETAVVPSAMPGSTVSAGGPAAPTQEPVLTPVATNDGLGAVGLAVALLVVVGATAGSLAWRRGWRPPWPQRGSA